MINIRAFIGIDFDRNIKNEIYELQQRLKKYAVRGRWKHSDNFHLTLKFMDEISEAQKLRIDDAMRKLCSQRVPFSLEVTGIGTFDGKDSVKVLWLGLDGNILELESLQKEIDKILVPLGVLPEKRRFNPHITIGQDIDFECNFDQIKNTIGKIQLGSALIDRVFLFKSEQIQNKRIYTKVSEYLL